MNNRRKLVVMLGAGALVAPLVPFAQQGKVWRIGYLDLGSRQSLVESGRYAALTEGLRERGYIVGKNLVLEERHADGKTERLRGLADELVRQKLDLILATGAAEIPVLQQSAGTIPIVAINTTDPVGNGFAITLAHPGGNITGMSSGADETVEKLVELLMVAAPKLQHIAVLANPTNIVHPALLLRLQAAAKRAGTQVSPINARTPQEIELGFAAMARDRMDGVIVLIDPFLFQQRAQITALALKHRLPSMYTRSQFSEIGGLMSYGTDYNDNYRRAGIFVDKILKGAKPGDIPFEQPTRYYLVINRKTANSLGIKLKNELLTRADKIID